MNKIIISKFNFPVDGYKWNVQVLTSIDGGENWYYCGNGKFAKSADLAHTVAMLKKCYNAVSVEFGAGVSI